MPLKLRAPGAALVESGQPSALIVTDCDLRVVHAAGAGLVRDEPERCKGRPVEELFLPAVWPQLEGRFRSALAGEAHAFDYWSPDASAAHSVQITPIRSARAEVQSIVTVIHEVTAGMHTTAELERSEARLRETERMIGVGSWELDTRDGTITCSSGLARMFQLAPGESLDMKTFSEMVHPEDRDHVAESIAACLREGTGQCEYRLVRPDGSLRHVMVQAETIKTDGEPARYLRGATLDVTEQRELERQRHAAESLFEQGFNAAPIGMALTDPVTGRYLRVNDALCRLVARSREELLGLTVAEITHPEDLEELARLKEDLADGTIESYQSEKRYLRPDGTAVWAALHVAPVRNPDGTIEALFAQKIDLTDQKERESRLAGFVSDAEWLRRIRDALDEDRLMLYCQPIVDLRTGETVQRELLVRMRGEEGEIIPPCEFLPVAERYGLISDIDRWVVRQAARLAADGTPTEFNLSAASIGDPAILHELARAIEATGVDPSLLVVEVTETAMMDHGETGRAFAEQLRALGCGLAIDDFGTGFASLSYLKYLQAEHLKIDIEFVRELAHSEDDERLVRGIVGFAREFRQVTTAEGIEDEATLEKLRELGVDRGQGYLFARPAPLEEPLPPADLARSSSAGCPDPVATVKEAFEAFADGDLDRLAELLHPDVFIRPVETARRVARHDGYRGLEGVAQYLSDVTEVWDGLRLMPASYWEVRGAVIAFGRALSGVDGSTQAAEVFWIYRLRDGLITSVDAFLHPGDGKAPVTNGLQLSTTQ